MAKISPRRTSNDKSSTAVKSPYFLVTLWTAIAVLSASTFMGTAPRS